MADALKEAQLRAARPKLVRDVFLSSNAEFAANGKIMDDIVNSRQYSIDIHFDVTNESVFLSPFHLFGLLASSFVPLVCEVVRERRSHPETKYNDLMDLMLEGKDPQTGEKLPIDRVRMNVCRPNNPGLL